MKTYRATENVYVDEAYVFAGDEFTTAAPKGKTWIELDAKGNPVDPLDHDGDGKRGGAKRPAAAE